MTRTTKTILCSILALALAATAATAYCLSRSTGNSEPTRIYLPLGTTTARGPTACAPPAW